MIIHKIDIHKIKTDDRFREDPTKDIESLKESIVARGLLQPIVVATVGEEIILLCGRRRLEAHRQLATEDEFYLTIAAVFRDELDEIQRRIVELEENIKRVDFNDLEKVKGVNEVHRLMQQSTPNWTMEQTARYLGFKDKGWVSVMMKVADHVDKRPESTAAKLLTSTGTGKGIVQAYKEIQRERVQQTQSILEQLSSMRAAKQVAAGDDGAERRAAEIVIHGDAFEVAKTLQSESVDFVHTDPPYGIDFDILEKGDSKNEMYKNDSLKDSEAIWTKLAPEIARVLKPNAFAVIWVSFVQMNVVRGCMSRVGFECGRKPFVWVKTGGPWAAYSPTKWFASAYDTALIFARGNPILVKQGMPDFSTFTPLQPQEKTHPLERPQLMLVDLMSRFTLPGMRVWDPFCGSGSTAMAALTLKCHPITSELDQNFFNVAKLNVVKKLKQTAVL